MKWERFRVAKASACDTEFMTLFGDDLTLRKVEAADSGGVGATEAQGQWAGLCAACGVAFCEH